MKTPFTILALAGLLLAGCGGKPGADAGPPATLADLNRALSSVSMMHPFPPSTNDIEQFLALQHKTMPVPPPGKKLYLDPQTRTYQWVDGE